MKKVFIPLGIFLLLVVIVFLLLKYTAGPSPVPIMSPSSFEKAEQIGVVIYKRFYDPLANSPFVVFGAPPRPALNAEIAEGFLTEAASLGRPYQTILVEPGVIGPKAIAGAKLEALQFNQEDMTELAHRLEQLKQQHQRVFIYTASIFTSRRLQASPLLRLQKILPDPIFTVTLGIFSVSPDHEFLIDPPCIGIARDTQGVAGLGCMMLSVSRRYYRKHLDPNKLLAVMDEEAPGDFLLLIASPEAGKNALSAKRAALESPPPPASGLEPEAPPENRTGSPEH